MKSVFQNRLGAVIVIAIITGLVFAGSQCSMNRMVNSAETKPCFPMLGNYADLYLRGSYEVLHMIRGRELEKIGMACKIGTQRKMVGGRIVSAICTPHIMVDGAGAADVPGNPNIAPEPVGEWEWKGFSGSPPLGAGDFLITANPSKHVEEPHKRGCFVLGVGFPMTTNRYSPLNFNDHPDYFIEDMSDIFIYTWGPKEDGLVMAASTPFMKFLPTSPMTVVAYWLIMAQLAHNLAYKDTSGTYDVARTYIDTLMARLKEFHTRYICELDGIGENIADRVLNGGRTYVWSGRKEFWSEAHGSAGAVWGMGWWQLDPDSLHVGDVVILATSEATPEREIEMARKCREKGAYLIGIFPFERDDGISTDELKELCDYSLDNLSGDFHGIFDMPGYPHKIIPTATMMNNFAYWAVAGAYVQAMERRGKQPYLVTSFHVPGYRGGYAYFDSLRPYFLKRGY